MTRLPYSIFRPICPPEIYVVALPLVHACTPNSGFRRAVFLVSILLMSSIAFAPMTSLASNSKSTTVWNGTINLVDGYTVESGEILVVEAGTEINLGR